MVGGWLLKSGQNVGSLERAGLAKVLDGLAAGRRDFAAIGHQAVGDAHAVGDELPAIGLGVHHACALILLRVRLNARRREHHANQSKRNYEAQFHDLSPAGAQPAPNALDVRGSKKVR